MSWRWLLALSSGIVLAALLPALPDAAGLAILGVVALSLLIHSRTRVFAVFLLGALWFLVQAQAQLDQQWPASRSGEVVEMQFRVAALPEWQGESLRFIAEPLAGDGALPSRILVRWYLPGDYIQTGQVWSVKARLQSPVGRLNFRGFDYTRHLLSQRIGALATVREAERIDGVSQAPGRIDRGRQYLAEVLAVETRSRVASGLMRALAIADRGGIDAETRVLLTETGTAHLLAISGLHIGMIAMLAGAVAMVLVGPFLSLMPRFDRRRLSLAIALAAALAYA
ncbi:MAG: ComEC/Rec2 family competence protein, partial [Pseudomonadota bacterium]